MLKSIDRTGSVYFDQMVLAILFSITWSVFSAVEMQKRKSSIVAIKVVNFFSVFISVIILLLRIDVLIIKFDGAEKLSGDIACMIVEAVFTSLYSRTI